MKEKLERLAKLIKEQTIEKLHRLDLACETNVKNAETYIREGNKYTKIDIGNSGKLMIENTTGIIYGIKGYGQVHKGHSYGTLDTIEEYWWGEFYPQKIKRT
jgi:hypothetical protein